MNIRLKYLGGGAFVHVPARDLTDEDFTERAELWKEIGITEDVLISSGIYERAGNVQLTAENGEKLIKKLRTKAGE